MFVSITPEYLKQKATSPILYFALTSQIGDFFMPPFFPNLPPIPILKFLKEEKEKEGWSVRESFRKIFYIGS